MKIKEAMEVEETDKIKQSVLKEVFEELPDITIGDFVRNAKYPSKAAGFLLDKAIDLTLQKAFEAKDEAINRSIKEGMIWNGKEWFIIIPKKEQETAYYKLMQEKDNAVKEAISKIRQDNLSSTEETSTKECISCHGVGILQSVGKEGNAYPCPKCNGSGKQDHM